MNPSLQPYIKPAGIIKALAHPARLLLMNLLAKGPVCVCELTAAVGYDISTVSLHLAVLKRAGLVAAEKKGNKVFYSLACPCVLDFMSCITQAACPAPKTTRRERRHV